MVAQPRPECEYGDNVFFLRSSLPKATARLSRFLGVSRFPGKDLNEAGFEELSQLEISFQMCAGLCL